jgi:signal transduction histidine kinase
MGDLTPSPESDASLAESLRVLLAGQLAPEAFGEAAITLVRDRIGAEVAVLLRWEPEATRLSFLASAGLKSRVLKFLAEKVGNGIGLSCLRERTSRLIPQAAKDPSLPPQLVTGLASEKGLALSLVPLHHDGVPAGAVLLFGDRPDAFSPYRIEVLSRSLGAIAEALVEGRVTAPPRRGQGAEGDGNLRPAAAPGETGDHGDGDSHAIVTAELASLWQEREILLKRQGALQRALDGTRGQQLEALGEVRKAVEAADSRARAAIAEVEALKAERKDLQAKMEVAAAARMKLEGEMTALRTQIATLQAANADVQAKLGRVAELQVAVDAGRAVLKARSETLEALTSERDELQRQLSLARMVAHRRAQAAHPRVTQTPAAADQVEELSEALAAGTAARLHLEVELARLRDQVASVQGERAEAQAWAEQRAKDLTSAQAEMETLGARLAVSRLGLEQADVQRQIIAELRSELRSLRTASARLERDRHEARTALEGLRASARAALQARAPANVTGDEGASFSDADVIDEELKQAFLADAEEYAERCDHLLLRLEVRPNDEETRRALFRVFHTLKGSAASAGFAQLAEQFHEGETLIERIQQGQRAFDADAIDSLFRLADALAATVAAARGVVLEKSEPEKTPQPALGEVPQPARHQEETPVASQPGTVAEVERTTVRVEAARLEGLLRGLGELGSTRDRMADEFRTLMALGEKLRTWCERVGTAPGLAANEGTGEVREGVDDVLALVEETSAFSEEISRLIDALAEEGAQFYELSSGLEKEVGDLRTAPLEAVFRRLHRPVRDAARQTRKLVDFVVRGGEMQIDRSLADALYSPLLHLLRNAVTHGIETPEVRERCRKPRTGAVSIQASSSSGELSLTVRDDGAGINLDRIFEKAVALRLVNPNREPTRDQLISLIFRPGFSTTDGVTELAGRGVGMDVVAQQAKALRGRVSLDTEDGRGTTVTLTVPLLAVVSDAA